MHSHWSLWPGGRTHSGVSACCYPFLNSSQVRVPPWGRWEYLPCIASVSCVMCVQVMRTDRRKCRAMTLALPPSQKQSVWVANRNLRIGFNWWNAMSARCYLPVTWMRTWVWARTNPSCFCPLFFRVLKWLLCVSIQREEINMGYMMRYNWVKVLKYG